MSAESDGLATEMVRLTKAERDALSHHFETNRFTALTDAIERIVTARAAAARADERKQVVASIRGVLDDTRGSGGYVVSGMVGAVLDNIEPRNTPGSGAEASS